MKFSVVMPSYLGFIRRGATERPKKLVRAIQSVIDQSFYDWELLVVSDGCEDTVEVVKLFDDPRIRLFKIEKQHNFSGTPRNVGIQNAKGKFIIYLDSDDVFLKDHLKIVNKNLGDYDWLWFNNHSWNTRTEKFDVFSADITIRGRCGTSNIAHKRSLEVYWSVRGGYAKDDWIMINTLRAKSENFGKIETPGYGICHVPSLLDI